jgi:ATP-dependent DNA helicase RecG
MEQEYFWLEPESRRIEFKETWPGGNQIANTAIAFANGAGGRIVFGVKDEPRQIIGVPEEEIFKLEEKASNHIFDQCAPTIIPEIYLQNVEGKNLLVVEIFPGYQKPYFLKSKGKHKGSYIRVGSVNRVASEETLISLEREGRKVSFDKVVVYDITADSLNLERFIADYTRISGRTLDKKKILNLGLFARERDTLYPTHAAILLSDSPERKRFFPYAKIECARFKGTETKVFLDQVTADGPIHDSIEPCMAFIKRNIALGSKIGEVYREDRWEYPLEAVREALINAVIHRDYSILGSDIKVAIFDDMMEITSPGPLPDNLPPAALGSGRSEIRNRILAPVFKDLKLIEAWGTGIQRN